MGNYIADFIFLVVGILTVFIFAKRGFLKSVIHFFKTILAFVAAYFLGSHLAAFISEKWISGAVRGFVFDKISGVYLKATESFDAEAAISSLPSFLMTEEMKANIASAEGSGEQLVNSMTDSITSPIASLFSNIIGYVGVFLIALVVLSILATVLTKMMEHVRLLNTVNTLLGAILGLLIAFVVLFIVASIMKFFFADSAIYTNSVIVRFFGESPVLNSLQFLNVGKTWFADLLG